LWEAGGFGRRILVGGSNPRAGAYQPELCFRLRRIQSEILERLEKDLQIAPHDFQKVSDLPVGNPKNSETGAWLFYHLKNVYNLTLAAREAVSRLLRSEVRSAA
jgi:hypothetical protein